MSDAESNAAVATAAIPSAALPAIARWRESARQSRRSLAVWGVLLWLIGAPLVAFPLAWIGGILGPQTKLSLGVPCACVMLSAIAWIVLRPKDGLLSAFLAGTFAAGGLLAIALARIVAIPAFMIVFFTPWLGLLGLTPIPAAWVSLRRMLELVRQAPFRVRPVVSTLALAAGFYLPFAAGILPQSFAVARGDVYLEALRSGDALRIEHAAAGFRPYAAWVGVPRAAVGDRELGRVSVGSSDTSSDLSALEWNLDRARWFR